MVRKRRSYIDDARERWPDAEWIIGLGRFAAVAECRTTMTVMLFTTLAEATQAKTFIDTHCFGACPADHRYVDAPSPAHEVVDLWRAPRASKPHSPQKGTSQSG